MLLIIIVLGQQSLATAQDERPTLGLVLSGGGAKGFAHIGVLKVLEKAGIKPDFVTGTSMGSIVGGLYAMGYSADSLEQIALDQDWGRVLTDVIPLNEVIAEEKYYFKNQMIELPFSKGKVTTPGGLIAGQEIERLLNHLTLPAYRINEFDSLPTPFRCMATDLYYGSTWEISEGSLPAAIRASMAIPSVFSPVVEDTLVLVDGGLIRNFPVVEAREMGANIIIGSHSGVRLTAREDLLGLSGILAQAIFLGSLQDSEIQAEDVDYYIEPEIYPFGAADFGSAKAIIDRGEKAAMVLLDSLTMLADSLNRMGPAPDRVPLPSIDSIYIDSIQVFGNLMYSDAEVLNRTTLASGKWIQTEELDAATNSLFGTNYFTKITYRLRFENGITILRLNCIEKANILIKGTLSYDTYHEAGIGLNLTFRNFLMPGSRLMLVGKIAENHRYRIEFLKYIGKPQRTFFQTRLQFSRDRLPVIIDGRTTSEYLLVDMPLDMGFYHRIGTNLLLGVSGKLERLSLSPKITFDPPFRRLQYFNFDMQASVRFSSLDRNVMPRSGSLIDVEGAWVTNLSINIVDPDNNGVDFDGIKFDPYPKITLHSENYFPTGGKGSIVFSPFAGIILTEQVLSGDFYIMGSPETLSPRAFPVYGLDANELTTQISLGTALGYQYFISDNILLAAHASGVLFSDPETDQSGIPPPEIFFLGVGLTAGYNTLIGPVSLTLSLPFTDSDFYRKDLKAFLSFGYRF